MTTKKRASSAKLKTFAVGYYLEQGFTVLVKAASAEDAESNVRRRLDEAADELPRSERVHCDYNTVSVEEVRS